jgi:hypothetical protein
MSWLSSFLHPERGYQNAQEESEKYYNQGQGYLAPYNQGGQTAGNTLQEMLKNLSNPQEFMNKLMQGYQTSDYAKNLMGQAQEHGLDAASSMGLMGSSPALSVIQQGTSNIGNADRQQYLKNLMDMYGQGVGLGENIYGVGAGAAGQQSQNAMNQGQTSAGLTFGKTNAPGEMFGKGVKAIGKLAANYLTGGFGQGGYGRGMFTPSGGS